MRVFTRVKLKTNFMGGFFEFMILMLHYSDESTCFFLYLTACCITY